MRILVRKMSAFTILKVQLILGAIVMVAASVALPVMIANTDPSLLLNPFIIGVVVIADLTFWAFAYFLFIRPYVLYRKTPDVLVETDGECLYIHGKKEVSIPLSEIESANTFVHLPFLYSNELIATLFTHLLSEKYGDIDLDVSGFGGYKLRFVSNVWQSSNELIAFINETINKG